MKINLNKNSILLTYNENTKPSEIFMEACNVIGEYYVEKGWKYRRSQPKLHLQKDDLKIEINFVSSSYNSAGSYVSLEILPYVGSEKLKKWIKENKAGRNHIIYAPKNYSFRNNDIYGISENELSNLVMHMDKFIEEKLNIVNNEQFLKSMFQNMQEIVLDSFAYYLSMNKDARIMELIDHSKTLKHNQLRFEHFQKYYD